MKISHIAVVVSAITTIGAVAASTSALASGTCKTLAGHYTANQTTVNCQSPTGICFTGTVTGDKTLNGTTVWDELDQSPSAGMPATEPGTTVSTSGTLTITTTGGTLTLRDVGVLAANLSGGNSSFAWIERTVGGTGAFATATGSVFLTGGLTNNNTSMSGTFSGQLCGL